MYLDQKEAEILMLCADPIMDNFQNRREIISAASPKMQESPVIPEIEEQFPELDCLNMQFFSNLNAHTFTKAWQKQNGDLTKGNQRQKKLRELLGSEADGLLSARNEYLEIYSKLQEK